MRAVFYSLSELTLKTAQKFIRTGYDVVVIDPDEERVQKLSESLDCGLLVGDASHPAIFQEVNPKTVDVFFALSEVNEKNLVACLVARSLGVKRVILRVDDPDYEKVTEQLDLKEVIIPSQISSQYLLDAVLNENLLELFQVMKNRAGLYLLTLKEKQSISDLNLPNQLRVSCYFREGKFHHYEEDSELCKGDQLVLLSEKEYMQDFIDRHKSE